MPTTITPESNRAETKTVSLIANPGAGAGSDESNRLVAALEHSGLKVQPMLEPPAGPDEAARRAVEGGSQILVAAGGDGTVSAVASAVAGTAATLGILPTGTLNHFAKDLNIPLDIAEAAAVIANGKTAQIDVAEVNGRVFINNSSLGIYSHFAVFKEQQRKRGRTRLRAAISAAGAAFKRVPFMNLRLTANGIVLDRLTPLVFIGNNDYNLEGLNVGTRSRVDGGNLSVVILHASSRWEMLRLSLGVLSGRAAELREVDVLSVTEAVVRTKKVRTVVVSMDGETERFETPLHYRTRPGALRVLVP